MTVAPSSAPALFIPEAGLCAGRFIQGSLPDRPLEATMKGLGEGAVRGGGVGQETSDEGTFQVWNRIKD